MWEADDDLESIVSDGWAFGPLVQQYAWTDAGRYAGSSSRFGEVTQTYDHLGRPAVLSDPYTGDVTYGYTAEGRLASMDRSTGLSTTFGYTATGRMASIDTVKGASVLEATRFAWDIDGRIEAVTDAEGDHAYTWDPVGRLLSADHPLGSVLSDEAYSYDANGNRTAWDGNADAQVTTNAQDQLLADAAFSYTYDLDGRLASKTELATTDATTYDWNSFGQLVRIGYADLTETTFRYDGLGRRIEVNHLGEVRRFVWDLGVIRAVLDANDELVTWSSTDPWGFLLAEWDAVAGTSEEQLSNHLMTVTGVVDAAGNAVRVPRDSFGNAPGGPSGEFEPYAVTWHGMDPSGLVYARGRYLDPTTGRFISEDPRPAANLYTYAGNNPLTAWDPTGAMVAVEYGNQSKTSTAVTTPSATRIGIKISCILMTDAGGITALTANPAIEIGANVACTVLQGRGRPGSLCFAGGTPVLTARGAVPIEDVESGDLVVSRAAGLGRWLDIADGPAGYPQADDKVARLGSDDGPFERVDALGPSVTFMFEDGVFQTDASGDRIRWTGEVLAPVGDTMHRVAPAMVEVEVTYEDGAVHAIRATPEHPFYVQGEGWVAIGELVPGDVLAVEGGRTAVVVGVDDVSGGEVYNFEVLGPHNYHVDDGVVVHNSCWRETFFEANPHLRGLVVVHHSIPRDVLRRFPPDSSARLRYMASPTCEASRTRSTTPCTTARSRGLGTRFIGPIPTQPAERSRRSRAILMWCSDGCSGHRYSEG